MLCTHDLHKISFVREYLIILSRMSNLNLILKPTITNFFSAAKCQIVSVVLILSLSFGACDFLHTSDKQRVKADWWSWKDRSGYCLAAVMSILLQCTLL